MWRLKVLPFKTYPLTQPQGADKRPTSQHGGARSLLGQALPRSPTPELLPPTKAKERGKPREGKGTHLHVGLGLGSAASPERGCKETPRSPRSVLFPAKGVSWEEVPQPALQTADSQRYRGTDVAGVGDGQTPFSLGTSGCKAGLRGQR